MKKSALALSAVLSITPVVANAGETERWVDPGFWEKGEETQCVDMHEPNQGDVTYGGCTGSLGSGNTDSFDAFREKYQRAIREFQNGKGFLWTESTALDDRMYHDATGSPHSVASSPPSSHADAPKPPPSTAVQPVQPSPSQKPIVHAKSAPKPADSSNSPEKLPIHEGELRLDKNIVSVGNRTFNQEYSNKILFEYWKAKTGLYQMDSNIANAKDFLATHLVKIKVKVLKTHVVVEIVSTLKKSAKSPSVNVVAVPSGSTTYKRLKGWEKIELNGKTPYSIALSVRGKLFSAPNINAVLAPSCTTGNPKHLIIESNQLSCQ